MNPLHVFEIDDGEQWHYVAPTAERALELFVYDMDEDATVESYTKQYPNIKITKCDPSAKLTIRENFGDVYCTKRKTCAKWAAELGEGFLR